VRFRKEIRFDGPVEQVRAMLLDPEFRNQVALATNGRPADSRIEETPEGPRSVNEIRPSLEELPAFTRPVVGAGLVIHQEEHWTSPDQAVLSVRSHGRPGHIEGTITLTPSEGGTLQTTDAEITARIPLVGGRVETLMGKILGNVLNVQGRLGNEWLTRPSTDQE
jgi:hypothetical protein